MEVALHKNNSDCKTNSDGGAEDAEFGNILIIVVCIWLLENKYLSIYLNESLTLD